MRKILFRGKSLADGDWIICRTMLYWSDDSAALVNQKGEVTEVDPATVGQYTGLLDRNGKMVFYGDVVEYQGCGWEEPVMVRAAVEWGDGGWYIREPDCIHPDPLTSEDTVRMTVVGNIHDNPELMEGTS